MRIDKFMGTEFLAHFSNAVSFFFFVSDNIKSEVS